MYGTYNPSIPQKVLTALLNLAGVLLSSWILSGGYATTNHLLHLPGVSPDPLRHVVILTLAVIYLLRFIGTGTLLRRTMPWSEALTVGIWIIIIHSVMAIMTSTHAHPMTPLSWLGVGAYLTGTYLNFGSEYMRKKWKENPANKGRLYTEGLFRYSRHMNYFGDVLAFSGYALVTGNAWAFVIPGLMFLLMRYVNTPMLEKYLAGHYPNEFPAYVKTTSIFFPCKPTVTSGR